jgi:hypothetical protein
VLESLAHKNEGNQVGICTYVLANAPVFVLLYLLTQAWRTKTRATRSEFALFFVLVNAPVFVLLYLLIQAYSLAHKNEGNQNQVRIAEAGGIEAVVEAMTAHQASARMQEWACRALKKLAEHGGGWDGGVTLWGGGGRVGASLRQRIKTAGGVERVSMAVKASIATHQTKTLGNAMLDIFAYEDAKYAATGTFV